MSAIIIRSSSLQLVVNKPRAERTWQEAVYLLLQGQGSMHTLLILLCQAMFYLMII
jgi:hypothetical protein